MAFTLPAFNLLCKIYTGPYDTRVLRLGAVPCNLAMGRRIIWGFHDPTNMGYGAASASLLLPALTDIRDPVAQGVPGSTADLVEVPAGSGRWYTVDSVDDIGKGFSNEHRFAWLAKLNSNSGRPNTTGLYWPIPMP